MSLANGQTANAATFNNAFMSRTIDTDTVGKVDLKNVAPESGDNIINLQKNINALCSALGIAPNQLKDYLITWDDTTETSIADKINELIGSIQIKYALLNNQTLTDITGFVLNSTTEKSAGFLFEIERVGSSEFRQIIQAQAVFDGADWSLTFANYSGSDILQESIGSTEHIILSIVPGTGQIQYGTGNLSGHTNTNLKVSQTRMKV